jgi:hypothetical protein
MKDFIKLRIAYYLLFLIVYFALYYFMGFEKTMILIGGTIVGELMYQERKK